MVLTDRLTPLRSLLAALALTLVAAACAAAGAAEEDPVRVGVNLWVGYDLLDVAEQQALFVESGVAVEIVDFTSLSDVVAAFERGQIDGMATTMLEVLGVRSETARQPEIVLVTDYSDGADVIVADPEIAAVADLEGRTVVAEAPLGPFILSRALATVGLGLDDVDLVVVDQLEIPALVASGRADAAVSFPPVSLELEDRFGFRQIFTTADIPGEVIDVVSIDAEFLERRPEVVDAIRRAWDAAIEYLNRSPGPAVEAMAAREGIDPEEMRTLLTEVELLTWTGQEALFAGGALDASCREAANVLYDLDLLTRPETAAGCAGGGES